MSEGLTIDMSNTRIFFRFLSVACYQLQELLEYLSEIDKMKEHFVEGNDDYGSTWVTFDPQAGS